MLGLPHLRVEVHDDELLVSLDRGRLSYSFNRRTGELIACRKVVETE